MKKLVFAVITLAFALIFSTQSVFAADGWISNGPYGGDIRKIVPDPNNPQIVFAVTAGGYFRSTDGGQLWQDINSGLNMVSTARDIAIDPNNSNHLLIAMWSDLTDWEDRYNRGIFESFDAGVSWQQLTILNPKAMDITFDTLNSNIIYAGTEAGVLKSTDGGASWSWKTQGILYYVNSIVVDPNNSSVIYAVGGFGSVLYKSIDQGEAWQYVPLPIDPGGAPDTKIHTVLIDPTNSSIIYVAVEDIHYGTGGLYKSVDAGVSWQKIFGEYPGTVRTIDVNFLPGDTNTLYLIAHDALYISNDSGSTWSTSLPLPVPQASDLQFINNDLLLGITGSTQHDDEGGLYKSLDIGQTWAVSQHGITAVRIRSVVHDPQNPQIIYAGSEKGVVYKSQNSGTTWQQIVDLGTGVVNEITIDPNDSNTLYISALDAGIYKSSDAGTTWEHLVTPHPSRWYYRVRAVRIDPANSNIIYAANSNDVFKSTDTGYTWTLYGSVYGAIYSMELDPNNSEIVYVGSEDDNQFTKFTPSGVELAYHFPGSRFYGLAIDPGDSNTIFFGGDRRVNGTTTLWKTSDGGQTWILWINGLSPLGSNPIYTLEFNLNDRSLYAGTMHGLFKLEQGQSTWVQTGFKHQAVVNVDITPQQVVYLATGAYDLHDTNMFTGGASVWQTIPSGDVIPPQIAINSPVGIVSTQSVPIDVLISDPSGVSNYSYLFDGTSISNTSTQIDLTYALPGSHTFLVEATDNAGNTGSESSVFIYSPTTASVTDVVDQMYSDGEITQLGSSIYSKLSQAQERIDSGDYDNARAILEALINQIEAQVDIHITQDAGDILIPQIQHLINSLPV